MQTVGEYISAKISLAAPTPHRRPKSEHGERLVICSVSKLDTEYLGVTLQKKA
jgi:hypothetical protein